MIKKIFYKYKEVVNYIFFGILAMLVSLVSFKTFDLILGETQYLISNIISWIITVIFAFFTNKIWVFESKSWKGKILLKEILTFTGARIFSLIVEEVGLWVFIDICKIGEISFKIFCIGVSGNMIAKIIMQVIVILLNYIFSKLIIFKKENESVKVKD